MSPRTTSGINLIEIKNKNKSGIIVYKCSDLYKNKNNSVE